MTEKVSDIPAKRAAARTPEEAQALKLWVVLSRAKSAVQDLADEDIGRHGLSTGEFAILETLYHKGPLLLGEVQRKILASSGGVTYLVDRLAQQGLVERRECATDRRARYAALTAAGEALMERIFPLHAAVIADAMAGLDADEKATAIAVLKKLGLSAKE
jgi:MarR family 2-MHQ and catechol resistance regulon transcriptional repressor